MTIATRGQGVGIDPPDSHQNTMIPSSPAQQQLADTMSSLQISENVAPTDCTGEPATTAGEENNQQRLEPDFPHAKLALLDEKISSPRWVVPVLPEQELECLLQASIELCKKGIDVQSEACQRFFREGLTISFTKILTDDAVNSWKLNIHNYINANCQRLVELCVLKLDEDWFPLLDLLAMVFNPNNKFHTFNASRASETVPPGSNIPYDEIYAQSPQDTRNPRGWLVDLINKFGSLGGFDILLKRFSSGRNLTVPVIYALIKPFGLCCELLTVHTVHKYLMPIVKMVPQILDNLTDAELKKEAKNESKNDAISAIIKAAKCMASRVPYQEEMIKNLEILRLKMILRLLQISSFNGKMNALNEVNKVIASVNYYLHRNPSLEEEEWLTAERMAKWIKENGVLEIVLRDSLHQPQYVEKLEKILRFIIKERALSLEDLDAVWAAQAGKHEAIVKNVHDLLAKLAWDFSPEQLDHLFECFKTSWKTANRKQREKLLELIRRLAEDDKDGVMAHKVLMLFWNLAHSDEVPTEIMDQALNAHVKILDYSCSQERDAQKTIWLDKCVEELKSGDKWALPALKQIREICCLYEPNPNIGHNPRSHHAYYRQEVIERLQNQHSVVILVTKSLTTYMEKVRQLVKENSDIDPNTYSPDRRYNHIMQVQERLNFLRFLLKDGQLWLCAEQAKQIWQCLAEQAVFVSDREACFKWFSKLMGDEPDLDPAINKDFFVYNILLLDPSLLTESGIKCFERFFKAVNSKEGKLKQKRRTVLMDDVDLIGTDYLWRVVTNGSEEIANRGIELLKEVNTNLGPRLQSSVMAFHETYIAECMDRLKAYYDAVSILRKESLEDKEDKDENAAEVIKSETMKMCRVMKVLQEYLNECDTAFPGERKILPLHRAARGKHLSLVIRFANPARNVDDIEVFTHTNDTLASLRRQILRRIKASGTNVKVDLFINGESLEQADDRKLLSQIPLRDKMLLSAKLSQANTNMPSSPDSSSDSSTSSPHHPYTKMEGCHPSSQEAESSLPGVLLSQRSQYANFFFQLADLGCTLEHAHLRDGARHLLQLVPPDTLTVSRLQWFFGRFKEDEAPQNSSIDESTTSVGSLFFTASPSQVLYNLEVLYTLLMPALDPMSDRACEFQLNLIKSGEAGVILDMLTKNNFLPNADETTKRSAYLTVLKLCKLLLTVMANVMALLIDEVPFTNSQSNHDNQPNKQVPITVLKQALHSVPNQNTEYILRSVAMKLATLLANDMLSGSTELDRCRQLLVQALSWELPDVATIRAIIRLAWAASSGSLNHVNASAQVLHEMHETNAREQRNLDNNDVLVCKEALEVLTIALVLNPKALEDLTKDSMRHNAAENVMWNTFLIDLVLVSTSRAIRATAAEQFLLISTWCSSGHQALQFFITRLFPVINTTVMEYAKQSHEFFQLLCRLLNYAHISGCPLSSAENWLNIEIVWLKEVRDRVQEFGDGQMDEAVLEGHLCLTKELLSFLPPSKKYELGSDEKRGINLIKELVQDFIFPASCYMLQLRNTGELGSSQSYAVCTTPQSTSAAFDLLVSLCTGCVPNMKLLVTMLCEMFYSEKDEPLVEWDYLPSVGSRPPMGFVGLKNAGATCYMNSVLQQLYMVESIRVGLLAAEGAATDLNEDFSGEERIEGEQTIEATDNDTNEEKCSADESRKEYNIGILKQVQAIFGHLAHSRLQYYIPRGLWKHFKLQGEPVNLREQQDAVEFFMSLVESLDEALKALGHEQIMSKILGGSYSDQKICKGCPHRYSKEEPFSVISVDIRNHSNLLDSLEQYVKGELLEGADSYHCDKCNKKVVTVKRLCVKKLPPILAIQLKRFEYDFERVCAIKFNDYFEFPRDLDMEPYTVSGLAKLEGEVIDWDHEEAIKGTCTKYQLTGIVVHSGQASGGHYYSYILHRQSDGTGKWYKFDDGDVTECKMEEEEEMKSQCFGGDYMGEVFDHILKRMNYRRQKRWWNAYMLFYTRNDVQPNPQLKKVNELSLYTKLGVTKMPPAIEMSVRKQNIKAMHTRNQFNTEYFQFIRKLVSCNPYNVRQSPEKMSPEAEELSMLSIQLASKFLFYTGFHTKKALRGTATDWHDILCHHLLGSKAVRSWFAHNVLFNHPHRFCEYLLVCPSTEVRNAFLKILVFLAHFSLQDGPCSPPLNAPTMLLDPTATLSDHLLHAVLMLLHREISDNGRHLPHYFALFLTYASIGLPQRLQLLKLNVPVTFMLVAIDEGPGPVIKYQYPELTKLHQVVSILIRCCDISSRAQTSDASNNPQPLPNPYGDPTCGQDYLMPIQPQAAEILFTRTSYMKKLIEDASVTEETVKLLQFCCWENPHFSRTVLSELLWQIGFAYTHELKHHTDLLLEMLLIEDSWQLHRVHNALKGVPDEREGLFDTIQKSRTHYQKRAYQCIKCMVQLFSKCRSAHQFLYQNAELKKKWALAIEWLQDELDKRPYTSTAPYTHAYNNWSPPAQSNESTNGYFLERSSSAKKTLELAFELCPDEEPEVEETSEDGVQEASESYNRQSDNSITRRLEELRQFNETSNDLKLKEYHGLLYSRLKQSRKMLQSEYEQQQKQQHQQQEQQQPGPSPVHTTHCDTSPSTNQDP
ncbi:probable ubiquitin carboxyl-terminal hydrolase FAF-X isoform X1 [Nasonia vitripennis]|uniref:USP domain-containing protein n=1 Tax=Nasonia vitripennis TaxID=7425 RepID=A0A7M7HDK5_NASVI|nr:probable ubiquitin carboxyl-terminal hydrolase FAF-X isoform X1 [Nasonia vitripennis]XP_008212414.1 probable ubiquitin carboxyl-terminal hydrolase FAF-X isoform X1 [Nasonia vitripennis]XP_008212415.1 probable ubiquitin carboxyl-terminal hydrolase FAF-X isoform X1 [Nasonia vitripennis]XP_031778880.1 probable ubiquitin carboxyl-terminal hydrolase FAF-X isoform X1 [Nasonia vitripennis]XP_032453504.1 probable ubiquitin carboxyl-terminal hydrolase FAF-X isoform X1 [Nasonia vitripennis]XP_0324535